jgi:hypothetical protein
VTIWGFTPLISHFFIAVLSVYQLNWRVEKCANKLASLSGNASLGDNDIGEFLL